MKTQKVVVKGMVKSTFSELEVDAYVFGDIAVHKSILDDGLYKAKWAITHLPSGYRLWRTVTRKQALELAEKIQPLGNWQNWKSDPYNVLTLPLMRELYVAYQAGYLSNKIDDPDSYTCSRQVAEALGGDYFAEWKKHNEWSFR